MDNFDFRWFSIEVGSENLIDDIFQAAVESPEEFICFLFIFDAEDT